MANYTRGAKKSAAARRGHKKTSHKKSVAGVRKAAWARWAKGGKSKKRPGRKKD